MYYLLRYYKKQTQLVRLFFKKCVLEVMVKYYINTLTKNF